MHINKKGATLKKSQKKKEQKWDPSNYRRRTVDRNALFGNIE